MVSGQQDGDGESETWRENKLQKKQYLTDSTSTAVYGPKKKKKTAKKYKYQYLLYGERSG